VTGSHIVLAASGEEGQPLEDECLSVMKIKPERRMDFHWHWRARTWSPLGIVLTMQEMKGPKNVRLTKVVAIGGSKIQF